MKTITALEPQKRAPGRVNLYLDGEFALGLDLETAHRLQVGQQLAPEAIAELQNNETFVRARQSAERLLAFRPRSEAEIWRSLKQKGYETPVIEQTIDHLREVRLLDDTAFVHYWIDQRVTFKPRSLMALRQELLQKGVPRPVIEAGLAAVDEETMARQAAANRANRWAHLPYEEYAQKMGRYLQQRGFSYELTTQTVAESWRELDANDSAS